MISKIIIRNSDCNVVNFLHRKRVEAEFKKIKVSELHSTHLLRLSRHMLKEELSGFPGSYMLLPSNYLWITTESCSACRVYSQLPVIVDSVSYVEPVGVVSKLIIPGRLFQKKLIEKLKDAGLDVEVISVGEFEDYELTRRQKEILTTMLKSGYLNRKREARMKDVAFLLGLSPSTISRIYRAAVKKILIERLSF